MIELIIAWIAIAAGFVFLAIILTCITNCIIKNYFK